jgi:LuxR family maltose regulon positive regulatory protein
MRKITMPRLSAIVPRKRLFALLDANLRHGSVWIGAQPGAGKTALVGSYLAARRIPVLWYQVAAADADPSTFFYRFALEVERRGRKRRVPVPMFTPEYAADLSGFARRFFSKLFERLKPPCAIVFDNCDEVPRDAPFGVILRALLDIRPKGVRVICTSREEPPDALARAVTYGMLRLVGWEALALQPAETAVIAAAHAVTDERAVAELHRHCDGWVAGLTLLLERVRAGGATPPAAEPSQAMFGYFAAEILDRLPGTSSDVLIRTAFFPQFSKAMAMEASDNTDAAKIVDGLVRRGYFATRSEGAEPRYRYHDLFREFLLATGRERLGGEEYRDAARRAAALLDRDAQTEAAVDLYHDTHAWPEVTHVVLRDAHVLLEQGRWQTLMGWITGLAEATIDEEPWLRFWLGICRLTTNPPAGRTELETAYAGFEADNNNAGQALAAAALIESYGTQFADVKRVDHWIDVLNGLVSAGVELPPDLEVRIRINLLVGLLSRRPGDPQLQRMEEWLEQFLDAPISPAQKMLLFITVFPYAYWHANAVQVQRLVNLVVRLTAPAEATPLSRLFGAMCLLYHASMMADFPAARDLFTRALKDADDFGLGFAAPMLNIFYAQATLTCGEIEIARKVIGVNAAAHAPTSDVTSYGQFQIVTARLAACDGNRNATIAAALAFRERVVRPGLMRGPMNTNGCIMLAQALEQAGAIGEAREMLACARREPTMFTNQFPLLDGHWHFVAAACALDAGDDDDALGHLKSGFGIASVNDYASLIVWSPELCARLCAEALQRGIEPDYVRRLISRHRLAPTTPDIESWPWPVQVYALGRFDVLVDGTPPVFGRKRPARPLELLKYLAAHGTRAVSETRIADALWPDLEGDEALNTLAINVHRLRRLLGHADAIVYQGRSIGLNPTRAWCDVAAFERRLEGAASATGKAERDRLVAGALALYQGDLLPDEDSAPWAIQARDRLRARSRAHNRSS